MRHNLWLFLFFIFVFFFMFEWYWEILSNQLHGFYDLRHIQIHIMITSWQIHYYIQVDTNFEYVGNIQILKMELDSHHEKLSEWEAKYPYVTGIERFTVDEFYSKLAEDAEMIDKYLLKCNDYKK